MSIRICEALSSLEDWEGALVDETWYAEPTLQSLAYTHSQECKDFTN